jgi:hypothetical protein
MNSGHSSGVKKIQTVYASASAASAIRDSGPNLAPMRPVLHRFPVLIRYDMNFVLVLSIKGYIDEASIEGGRGDDARDSAVMAKLHETMNTR